MKVLSLLQPWASLVVMGIKKIETRSWNTKHRGDLLIHASLGKAGGLLATELPFSKYIKDFNDLPFGAIIGKVTLDEVVAFQTFHTIDETLPELTLEERAFGDYNTGRFGWIFSQAVAFEKPIPARGSLHIWEWTVPDPLRWGGLEQ